MLQACDPTQISGGIGYTVLNNFLVSNFNFFISTKVCWSGSFEVSSVILKIYNDDTKLLGKVSCSIVFKDSNTRLLQIHWLLHRLSREGHGYLAEWRNFNRISWFTLIVRLKSDLSHMFYQHSLSYMNVGIVYLKSGVIVLQRLSGGCHGHFESGTVLAKWRNFSRKPHDIAHPCPWLLGIFNWIVGHLKFFFCFL